MKSAGGLSKLFVTTAVCIQNVRCLSLDYYGRPMYACGATTRGHPCTLKPQDKLSNICFKLVLVLGGKK